MGPAPNPVQRLWIRSALAPPAWTRWLALGVAGIVAVLVAEVVLGEHAALGSALAVVAIAVGLWGGRGDAITVAVACIAAAALSGLFGTWDAPWTLTVVVVAAASVAAVLVALLRATAVTTARQLALLRDLARLAGGDRGVPEIVEALLDLIVPAYADISIIDLAIPGYERRAGVRVAGPERSRAEAWLRRRPPVDPELPGAQRAIVTGEPGIVQVDDEMLQRIAADATDLAELRRIGSRSLLVLPLATRGAPFGALSLILGPSGRRYAPADLEFAQLVQGRMSIVLDNTGLSRAAARSEQLMVSALDTLEEAVTMNDRDGRTVYVNQAAVRLLQAESADDLLRAAPGTISARFEIYDADGEPVTLQDMPAFRALAGEEGPGPLLVRNVVRATGQERWLLNKVSVLRDASGAVDRIVNVIEDVTSVKQAEVRQRLLGEATRVLSGSGEDGPAYARVAEVLVPELADWCAIEVLMPSGLIEAVAIAHVDPEGKAAVRELRTRHPIHISERRPLARVVATGTTVHVRSIAAEALREHADDERHLELLRTAGFGAVLVVPLVGGGETLGAIALVRRNPVRAFLDEEVRLAEELGHRAGIALLNARLSTERETIARELQEGLRPPALPAVPGLETATLYRPAGELNDVGGDFYDAFPTLGGWTVSIGDVAGQGARAAALTGVARHTLRSVAQHTGDPSAAMSAVNRALQDQAEMALCTLAVLRLHRAADGSLAVTSLSAGHPLPILLRDGAVRELGTPGPIAGVFEDVEWHTATETLADGDTILLYTDGVLDTVGDDGRFGDDRLLELLDGAPADPVGLVGLIDAALGAFQSGPQRDDTAIVALTVRDAAALAAAIAEAHATA
jgi:serine phosphatase RsbU (regulator of sigma subunit)/PAS domain-containing protein